MVHPNDSKNYDAIIVGAGFAGLIAARELTMLGHRVLILEGRDRIGGRTWTDHRLGADLEMGGTYVHWYQPHIWSEITRYNLEIYRSPAAKKAYWITGGKLRSGTPQELNDIVKECFEGLMAEANKYLPLPFSPLHSSAFKELDGTTVREYLEQFDLTTEEYDFLSSLLATDFNGPPGEGAITQMFRWWAFSNGNRYVFSDTVAGFKIKTGTRSLINGIASDVNADIQLSTTVTSIEQKEGRVTVYSEDGQRYQANAVIVTSPLSVLDRINFEPPLSKVKQAFAKEGQISKGVKVWARVKGEIEPFVCYAPAEYPLNCVNFDTMVDGDSIIVGFGPDANSLDPNDCHAVEKALRLWLPDIEVVESTGHNWAADELSLESWTMLKPNQLTAYAEEMKQPENGVFLAGTAYANGWGGFIDGAIESGITTSRKVHEYLGAKKSANAAVSPTEAT
ncbi:amino acid oxidase [Bacillus sp. MUM 116]|uniref:flavin monoamine oxidase family protein n=1 Tax=Bacillus sp. MUM 116 TaxID=1678002 RepID=UPI0008F57511|nr:NAD(P)/FAD-dependent oxidoreductase [Bacillus sp. MUM 116]OIK10853.1 amino acid oxidase [Bacillus sp. MUM 116]